MNVPKVAERIVKVARSLVFRCSSPCVDFRSLAFRFSPSRSLGSSRRCCISTSTRLEVMEKEQQNSERPFFLKAKPNKNLQINLTDEQKQAIVDQLNSRTFEELTKAKGIGKHKAEMVVLYREAIGPFTALEQLYEVKGFGKAFFQNLQENGQLPPVMKHNTKGLQTLGQLLTNEEKESISSIVSIDIGFQNAAWVHIDRDRRVLDWCCTEVPKPKPYNPALFRPVVQKFADSLPAADAYVVELQSHRISKHASAFLPFVLHLRVFEAMLHCILPGYVVPFNPHYTSKHFCLPVGRVNKKKAAVDLVESLFLEKTNEVSFENECEQFLKEQTKMEGSQDVVSSIVDPSKTSVTENGRPLLQISAKEIDYFKTCKKRDDLSDCLLQALAFYDLVVES